jgi:hypothetical protein
MAPHRRGRNALCVRCQTLSSPGLAKTSTTRNDDSLDRRKVPAHPAQQTSTESTSGPPVSGGRGHPQPRGDQDVVRTTAPSPRLLLSLRQATADPPRRTRPDRARRVSDRARADCAPTPTCVPGSGHRALRDVWSNGTLLGRAIDDRQSAAPAMIAGLRRRGSTGQTGEASEKYQEPLRIERR